jgi:hypothetical protein
MLARRAAHCPKALFIAEDDCRRHRVGDPAGGFFEARRVTTVPQSLATCPTSLGCRMSAEASFERPLRPAPPWIKAKTGAVACLVR